MDHNSLKFSGKILKREKRRIVLGVEEPYNALDHLLQEVLDLINNILKEKDKLKEESKSSEKGKMLRDNFAQKVFERPSEQMGHGHECSGKPDNVANESTGFGENSTIEVLYEEDDQFVSIEPQIQHEPDIQEQSQNKHESDQPQLPHKEGQIEGPSRKRRRRAGKNNMKKTTLEYLEEKNCQKNKLRIRELDIEERKQKLEEQRLEIDRERLEFEAGKFSMEMEERTYLIKLMQSQQELISSLIKQNPARFVE